MNIRKSTLIAIGLCALVLLVILFITIKNNVLPSRNTTASQNTNEPMNTNTSMTPSNKNEQPTSVVTTNENKPEPIQAAFVAPLDNAKARVTRKSFGTYVTPQNSPVQPEKFSGYHVGTDFEMLTDEEQKNDIAIHAVCDGVLKVKQTATGYGGVAVESCILDGKPITVIYGHLRLSSIKAAVGDSVKAGDILANLGTGYSAETDGERKHLHLGFHLGSTINIRGYVSSKPQLSDWLDPCVYVCK